MKRLASEVIRELEARVARLENQSSSNRYADPFLAELQADIDAGMVMADELEAARQYDPLDPKKNYDYSQEWAFGNTNCYNEDGGGQDNPGGGTCYRLHHEYGEMVEKLGPKWWKNKAKKKEYNELYDEFVSNKKHKDRTTCPDGNGGSFNCEEARKNKK
jgi:hypothetical protein